MENILNIKNNEIENYIKKRLSDIKINQNKQNFQLYSNKSNLYSNFFYSSNKIQISDYPEFYIQMDDENQAYSILLNKINLNKTSDNKLQMIANSVRDTVYELIGQTNHAENFERVCLYNSDKNHTASIKSFYYKDISSCSERAALAHNLFKFLGIESYYATSKISINGTKELHNFNIIKFENKTYIFDLACTPIIINKKGEKERMPLVKTFTNEESNNLFVNSNASQFFVDLSKLNPVSFVMPSGNSYTIKYGINQNIKEKSIIKL